AIAGLCMASGVPIRKVRLLKKDETIRAARAGRPDETWVKSGSTHHVCIFEWAEPDPKGKPKEARDAVFLSMLEAKRRVKAGEPIIQKRHPDRPDAKFVMSLSRGELVPATCEGFHTLMILV